MITSTTAPLISRNLLDSARSAFPVHRATWNLSEQPTKEELCFFAGAIAALDWIEKQANGRIY